MCVCERKMFSSVPPWDVSAVQNELETRYGPPPFSSLQRGTEGIPARSAKRKRSNTLNPSYRAKYPFPNYTSFRKPEYFDTYGREYKLAPESSELVQNLKTRGEPINTNYTSPHRTRNQTIGSLVMWMRIPIHTRNEVMFPEVVFEQNQLQLYHIESQVPLTATVKSVFHRPNGKTGYAILTNVYSQGESPNPEHYLEVIRRSKRPLRKDRL